MQVQGRGRRKHHQAKRWHRSKRSISTPRHVEALVVADTTMMAFHQDGDVETYLLTIMNMVSALYLDPTIGNFINIVVVRIILVEEEDAEVPTYERLKSLLDQFRDKRATARLPYVRAHRTLRDRATTRDQFRFCSSKG